MGDNNCVHITHQGHISESHDSKLCFLHGKAKPLAVCMYLELMFLCVPLSMSWHWILLTSLLFSLLTLPSWVFHLELWVDWPQFFSLKMLSLHCPKYCIQTIMCLMIFHKSQPSPRGETGWNLIVLVQGLCRWEHQGPWWCWDPVHSQRCCSIPREAVLTYWCQSRRNELHMVEMKLFGERGEAALYSWFWASASGVPAVRLCSRTQTKAATCISWVRTQREKHHGCEIWVWCKQGTGPGVECGIVPQHDKGDHSLCSSSSGWLSIAGHAF